MKRRKKMKKVKSNKARNEIRTAKEENANITSMRLLNISDNEIKKEEKQGQILNAKSRNSDQMKKQSGEFYEETLREQAKLSKVELLKQSIGEVGEEPVPKQKAETVTNYEVPEPVMNHKVESFVADKIVDVQKDNSEKIVDLTKGNSEKIIVKEEKSKLLDYPKNEKLHDVDYQKNYSKPHENHLRVSEVRNTHIKRKAEPSVKKVKLQKGTQNIRVVADKKVATSLVQKIKQEQQQATATEDETEQQSYSKIRDDPLYSKIHDEPFSQLSVFENSDNENQKPSNKEIQKKFNKKIFEESRAIREVKGIAESDDFRELKPIIYFKEDKTESREKKLQDDGNRQNFPSAKQYNEKTEITTTHQKKIQKNNSDGKQSESRNENRNVSHEKRSKNKNDSKLKNSKAITKGKELAKNIAIGSLQTGVTESARIDENDTADAEDSKAIVGKTQRAIVGTVAVKRKLDKVKNNRSEKVDSVRRNDKVRDVKMQDNVHTTKNTTKATKKSIETSAKQKAIIKKSYAQKSFTVGKNKVAKVVTTAVKKGAVAVGKGIGKAVSGAVKAAASNPWVALAVVVIVLLGVVFMGAMPMMQGGTTIVISSYVGEDETLIEVDNYYSSLENQLKLTIQLTETTHSAYDVYQYDTVEIGHDSYALISYLTVKYGGEFELNSEVETELERLFDLQYDLSYEEFTAIDNDTGEELEGLKVVLTSTSLTTIIKDELTDEEYSLYCNYMIMKGNRPNLFDEFLSSQNGSGQYTDYEIPPHYLTDSDFRALITEAEKYLGYPYVWGGSSPSTSFDCSGFVCWVLRESGVMNISRTSAQGVFNQTVPIAPSEATAGDLVFFTGTYDSVGAVSHIGIYVGDNMMIHCGDPISYADLTNPYWDSHFYAFTRIP